MAARWSLPWSLRPSEEAALFNPAFCGELIARCVRNYEQIRGDAMALPLAFLVAPLVLHMPTRAALPGRANMTLGSWTAENEAIASGLADRTLQLRPISREALLFLTQHQALAISANGVATGAKPVKMTATPKATTDEVDDMRRAAGMVGRWFANAGAATQVLQTMGVQP